MNAPTRTIPTVPPGTSLRVIVADPCQAHLLNGVGQFEIFERDTETDAVFVQFQFDGARYAGPADAIELLIDGAWTPFKDLLEKG